MQHRQENILKVNLSEVAYLEQFNMKEVDFPATAKEIIMTGVQKNKSKLFYKNALNRVITATDINATPIKYKPIVGAFALSCENSFLLICFFGLFGFPI